MTKEISRRNFVQFMTGVAASSVLPISLLSCSKAPKEGPFIPLKPSDKDELLLAKDLEYKIIISWDDVINGSGEKFGFNNDYIACQSLNASEALMWVNHEYVNGMFVSGFKRGETKTKEQIDKERKALGGSILKIKKEKDSWVFDKSSPLNKRIDATTPMPIIAPRDIAGSKTAIGTMGGCAGGVTPWGTILSCEENVDIYYGERWHKKEELGRARAQWSNAYKLPSEHYGWVVEVDLKTGKAKKHTSMGRFAHESATVVELKDKRVVVYTGDDAGGEHVYKFIGSKPGTLEEGELFVADTKNGKWLSLDINKSEVLKKHFKDQTEVLTYCRQASKLVGATPLDRPEDIEIHPQTGDVFVTLTNNKDTMNYYGSIFKISENNGHESMTFKSETFVAGGDDSGFACPDNLAFDSNGNLWMVTDMSGSYLNKFPYSSFKNNGLFYIPMSGKYAGQVYQVASAPVEAELTGLCFSPDNKSLFLAVQHPGEKSKSLDKLTSHWPNGNSEIPKPSVVEIKGPLLDKLLS